MASGKSLEPKIDPRSLASWVCACGGDWSEHQRKDGKGTLAKYSDRQKHYPLAGQGFNRSQRRKLSRMR